MEQLNMSTLVRNSRNVNLDKVDDSTALLILASVQKTRKESEGMFDFGFVVFAVIGILLVIFAQGELNEELNLISRIALAPIYGIGFGLVWGALFWYYFWFSVIGWSGLQIIFIIQFLMLRGFVIYNDFRRLETKAYERVGLPSRRGTSIRKRWMGHFNRIFGRNDAETPKKTDINTVPEARVKQATAETPRATASQQANQKHVSNPYPAVPQSQPAPVKTQPIKSATKNDHQEQLQQAYQLLKEKKVSEGTQIVKTVLTEDPKNSKALILMGHIMRGKKKPDLARTYYQKAVDLGSSNAQGFIDKL